MKNKVSWNNYAAKYSANMHSDKFINTLIEDPTSAFHQATWKMIKKYIPDMQDKKVCVPSSGDNHAVFAFAMMGAKVTSCDISENQLANAERIAKKHGWNDSIEFICADTMTLADIINDTYDFVYTSNGVHVWINDLPGMYNNIHRVMKAGGIYIMYEIHPFTRPFGETLKVIKPYDAIGPFETEKEVTFHWRAMDIMNAIFASGLAALHIEEMYDEKNYDWPFWMSLQEFIDGATATPEEVDRMHDWRHNPMAALPNWLSIAARK